MPYKNKEDAIAQKKVWYEANKEKIKEQKLAYVDTQKSNGERWRDENPGRQGVNSFNHRTTGDKVVWNHLLTEEQDALDKIYTRRDMLNEYNVAYDVDHIVSIEAGGLHTPSNLQIITRMANKFKGNR